LKTDELIEWCIGSLKGKRYIDFPEEIFNDITEDVAHELVSQLHANTFMKLPAREIEFFEWIKRNDPPVWDDLWGGTDEEPYIVAISFLPLLLDSSRGFPICDLVDNDNYYFTDDHIADKESRIFLDSVKQRFLNKDKLSISQTLVLEISLAPIDIWHFAYRFKINIDSAKNAVRELVDDNIIIHLTDASHLAGFIDI
jgi:hypothetical protein